jgi:hypothetical protein
MCDVPMLCLWIWTVIFWLRGSRGSVLWLPIAGFVAGLAALTKYPAISLIPLLAAQMMLERASVRVRVMQILSLLIPLIMIAAYDHYTRALYGRGLFLASIAYSINARGTVVVSQVTKLFDGLIFVGGGALAVALVAVPAIGSRWRWAILAIIPILMLAAAKFLGTPMGWTSPWWFFLQAGMLAAGGVLIGWLCVVDLWRSSSSARRSSIFLLLWTGGIFVFGYRLNWSINARSFVPLLPPVAILAARTIERQSLPRIRPYLLAASIAAIISLLAMVADYDQAVANCAAPQQLMKNRNTKVWFTGHWGFEYYMQIRGAVPLNRVAPECKAGDILIVPLNNYGVPPASLQRTTLSLLSVDKYPWMSLLNETQGAEFYFSNGDQLPFVFGPMPPEAYAVFQVIKPSSP